jgi:hypothetical protein
MIYEGDEVMATRAMNWPPCDYCSAVAKLALASI